MVTKAKLKDKSVNAKMEKSLLKAEEEMEEFEGERGAAPAGENIQIKSSKPISQLKKGDKIKVDSLALEIDAHYVLIDHGSTKEMTIELFDPKTDKEYQLRYFSDRVEDSLEFFELNEIIYNRRAVKKVEW